MLEQVFGAGYRSDLRRTLLERAAETDDPAYADRLREAADGKRPLRSLLADPSFQAALKLDEVDRDELESRTPTPEQQQELSRRLAEHREEHGTLTFPPVADLAAFAADAQARAQRTRDVVAADELTGWQGSQQRIEEQRAAERARATNDRPERGTDRG
ncbi:hypothetical protein [Cellulomonas endometrii]|uniref:hypothetical protein n=1 Tax=Cellulomonas endometrii TaxID=3036301 RepID=UPI0024AD8DF8|nr:hypothetical protein [Cellulomonas endometrii]